MIQVIDSNGNIKNVVISSTTIGSAINAVSAGTAAITSGTIVFSNSNGVSFGVDGQTITASFSGGGGGGGGAAISAGANSQNTGTVIFSNSNGLTFGLNAGTLTASHNGITSQSNQAFSAQGGSSAFQTLSFNNANGITFSNNAGAIEASYTVPSTAGLLSNIRVSAGTTSNLLSAVTFNNSNGVSFGLDNGTITATVKTDYLTTAMQSGASTQFVQANANFAGTNASGTIESSGISVSVANASNSSWTVSDAATSMTVGRLAFTNSNGITMTLSTSNNGNATLIASHNGLTSQSNQAISGSNGSFAFETVTFGNLNGLSFYSSNGSMVGSYTVPSTAGLLSAINVSAGTTSANTSAVTFSNSNGISFGYNGGTITASHNGLTTAMASNASTQFVQANANFAGTNASGTIASSGISISVNAAGGASNLSITAGNGSSLGSLSQMYFANSNDVSFGISTSNNGSATITASFQPTVTEGLISYVNFSASNTSKDLVNVYFSNANGVSFGLDTLNNAITASVNAGGGGLTLSYFNPQDAYLQVGHQQGQATLHLQPIQAPNVTYDRIMIPYLFSGATNSTASVTLSNWVGIYTRNNSTLSLSTSYSSSTAFVHSGTASSSVYNGVRLFSVSNAGEFLSEGQYWVAHISRTTTGGANATFSHMAASQQNSNFSGLFGVATNATYQYTRGLGHYSASTTALPSSIAFSQINGTASAALRQPLFYFLSGTV